MCNYAKNRLREIMQRQIHPKILKNPKKKERRRTNSPIGLRKAARLLEWIQYPLYLGGRKDRQLSFSECNMTKGNNILAFPRASFATHSNSPPHDPGWGRPHIAGEDCHRRWLKLHLVGLRA